MNIYRLLLHPFYDLTDGLYDAFTSTPNTPALHVLFYSSACTKASAVRISMIDYGGIWRTRRKSHQIGHFTRVVCSFDKVFFFFFPLEIE